MVECVSRDPDLLQWLAPTKVRAFPGMSQPVWKFLANLGDATPLEHGGLFVYEDESGVYGCEMERIEPNEDGTVEVRRVCLDRLKEIDGYLIPFGYDASWPYPASRYSEWFAKDLESVAEYCGNTVENLREMLCSPDGLKRAEAYCAIYDFHGWDNRGYYPETYTAKEASARYAEELAAL